MRHVTQRQPESARQWRRRSGWRAVLITAVAAAVVVAVTIVVLISLPGSRAAPAASRTGQETPPAGPPASSLAPARGVLLGASVQVGVPGPRAERTAVAAFERTIGRKLAINNLYVPWNQPMPAATARWDLARGTIPMISWAGTRTDQVVTGADDAWIRAEARQFKVLRAPVFLRWFAEMNLKGNQAKAVSPTAFVAAWRRIHQIFRRVGAANVRWVWCPNSSGFAQGTTQAYYPGNAYVDWICADGYNWAPDLPGVSWKSFQEIFAPFYRWGRATGKPMVIGEFGTVEGAPGAKAAWFAQAARAIRTQFTQIRAVVYFESKHQNFGRYFDWRVTSSRSALSAFQAFAHDPYFSARPRT